MDFKFGRQLYFHITLDGKQLGLAIRSYWQSDLLSVGVKVLETLQSLYNLTLKGSAFHQSTSLLHVFEVSKFLLDCQYLNLTDHHMKTLQVFLGSSMTYFDYVFPLDWRKSVSRSLIALRESDLSLNLLEEVILQYLNIESDLTHWTIGRVMMICLSSKKSVAFKEKIIRGFQWNPLWKSFVEKFSEDGFNEVYVAPTLQNALEDTYRAYWWFPGYMSPHSFVYLVDRLLFMASFSSGVFFTTKSSFVEWYTYFHMMSTPDTKQIFSKDIAHFLVGIVQHILYKKEETISWIGRSNIVASYYHPLIALKLVMIVSLISLQLLDCSQVVIDLLWGWNNIAYLLPKKFVDDLLRRRNGFNLNLNPDMVAEAFASIEDPLLIVSSENATPRVHAPCAIFVDLRRSRIEIMSVLFPGETTLNGQKDNATSEALREENHVEETSDEHSNGDHSLVELEVESQSSNNNTHDSGSKTGNRNSRRKKSKKNRGSNTQNTLATVLLDEQPCAREGVTPPEAKNSWDVLTTLLERNNSRGDLTTLPDAKNSWDDLTTLQEGNNSCGDPKQPFYASNTSRPEVELPVSTSGKRTGVQTTAERLQSSKRMVDAFSSQSAMGREWKVVKKVGSESSNTIEALPEEKCVEEADDQHSNVGQSLLESVLENKTSNDSTQNVEIKKGKGKNKGKWIKKNKDSNSLSTFTGDDHISDLSPVELKLEKQTSNENSKDVEFKEGKGKNMEKWIKKNKVSNSVNTFNGDDTSNDHPPVELMLEKQTSNENTQDAEIKKGKWWSKKNKGSSSLNTFTTVLVDGQQCAGEETTLQEANTAFNDMKQSFSAFETSQPEADLLVSKSGETTLQTFVEKLQSRRPMVDGFFNYVGLESSNITETLQVENHAEETDHDELSIGDHSPLELWLESQSSNDTTQDMENKKRKGKYVIGEDRTMCEENNAYNDLEPSSAFDRRINTLDAVKCGSFLGLAVAFLGIRMWRKT